MAIPQKYITTSRNALEASVNGKQFNVLIDKTFIADEYTNEQIYDYGNTGTLPVYVYDHESDTEKFFSVTKGPGMLKRIKQQIKLWF